MTKKFPINYENSVLRTTSSPVARFLDSLSEDFVTVAGLDSERVLGRGYRSHDTVGR